MKRTSDNNKYFDDFRKVRRDTMIPVMSMEGDVGPKLFVFQEEASRTGEWSDMEWYTKIRSSHIYRETQWTALRSMGVVWTLFNLLTELIRQ